MKATFFIILCLLQQFIFGQNNWVKIDNHSCDISFSMPQQPNIYDTLDIKYYNTSIDTNIVFQVHAIHNEQLDDLGDSIWNNFIQQLLIVTNGELTQNKSVKFCENEHNRGRLIGVRYNQENIYYFMFINTFINDENLIVQSIVIPQHKLPSAIALKNKFFNSLKCEENED